MRSRVVQNVSANTLLARPAASQPELASQRRMALCLGHTAVVTRWMVLRVEFQASQRGKMFRSINHAILAEKYCTKPK
jgi:hypothetical protein